MNQISTRLLSDIDDAIVNKANEWPELVIDPDFDNAGLTPVAARLYVHLWCISRREDVNWPGITRIASVIRTRRETVIDAIKELEERGFLKVTRRWGRTTLYEPLPKPLWKGVVTQSHQSPKRTSHPKSPVPVSHQSPKVTSHPNALRFPSSPSIPISGSSSPTPPSSPPLTPPFSLSLPESEGQPPEQDAPASGRTKSRTSKPKPLPPTVEEMIAYSIAKGISKSDAEELFESWSENNWKDGRDVPIFSWKSKLLRFKSYGRLPSQSPARRIPVPQSSQPASYEECKHHFMINLRLPESDALWWLEHMKADGWLFRGHPMHDWRSRTSALEREKNYFPSQKNKKRF